MSKATFDALKNEVIERKVATLYLPVFGIVNPDDELDWPPWFYFPAPARASLKDIEDMMEVFPETTFCDFTFVGPDEQNEIYIEPDISVVLTRLDAGGEE